MRKRKESREQKERSPRQEETIPGQKEIIPRQKGILLKQKSVLPGAVAMALISAVIIYVVMLNAEKNALSDYEKGTILTAHTVIPKGQEITEANYEYYIMEKEIDKKLIPETAVQEEKDVIGLLPVAGIDAGAMLTRGMFESFDEITGKMKEPVVAGFKAEDLYQVVGGTLRAGDRIHIYTVDEETMEVSLIWQEIFVQQVFDASGNAIGNEDQITAALRVNIFIEKDSSEDFYAQLSAGSLRVTKVWD